MHGHLDTSELDDLTLNHERLALNYRLSMAVRASVVARLLGTQSPDVAILTGAPDTASRHVAQEKGPSGL